MKNKENKIYLKEAPKGYMNLSNFDKFERDKIIKDNYYPDYYEERIYKFDPDNVVYVGKDIVIKAYSNYPDIFFDPIELFKLYKNIEGKNIRHIKQSFSKNIPKEYLVELLVEKGNKVERTTLVTENGLYYLVSHSDNPKFKDLKKRLLSSIHEQRILNKKTINDTLKYKTAIELVDPETSNHIINNAFLEFNVANRLRELCNKGEIIINYITKFPTINKIRFSNENILYYIYNLDKVKVSHNINIRIRADRAITGLANAFNTSEKEILSKFEKDIFELTEVEGKIYISLEEINNYLRRFKNAKHKLKMFLLQVIKEDKLEIELLDTIYYYSDIIFDYPIDNYIKYHDYRINKNLSEDEAKSMIFEDMEKEIIY